MMNSASPHLVSVLTCLLPVPLGLSCVGLVHADSNPVIPHQEAESSKTTEDQGGENSTPPAMHEGHEGHAGHEEHAHDGDHFVFLSEPFEANFFEGWFDRWEHSDFSREGTAYVHAFGIEPAFLCRDVIANAAFVNGPEGKEYEVEGEIEFALTRRIGLVVEGGYAWLDQNDESGENGIGDIAVAPRFLLLDYDRFLLSLNTEFSFPTGDDERGLGSGETIFAPSVSTWLDLGSNITLQNNVGIEHGLSSSDDVFIWAGALSFSIYTDGTPQMSNASGAVRAHFPRGMLSLIAEIGGEVGLNGEERGAGSAEWIFGVSYSITPKLQLRASLGFPAWNPREFDNAATVGFLYHF
jgi:hypothetical protein